MRGRLIQKFKVFISRLDELATDAVIGGGWDADFNEALPVDDGSQLGDDSTKYHTQIELHCQIDRKEWGNVELMRNGRQIKADIILTLHVPELVAKGMINTKGQLVIREGDRIDKINDLKGNLEVEFENPPGMFVKGSERAGHGLAAFRVPKTNLFYLYCAYDEKGKVA